MSSPSDLDPSELPRPLELLDKHDAIIQSIPTSGSLLTDWFIEIEPLPTDLVVPSVVFSALREIDEDVMIVRIAPTQRENWCLSGGFYTESDPSEAGADALREHAQYTVHLHDSVGCIELESADRPDNHVFRHVKGTRLEIINVQNHAYRDGWSLYLYDPEADADIEWQTLADLLNERD